ncbi:hypothetical protein C7R93_06515 [Brevibacillus fortis]|uniref:Uncharacterized protein n=1 Tax=Brevibacillus fortis TaxID=2126352 RepID=A0A2P7VGI5_9BACL|nr:hypothetical protein C7R93_06515 [Brevibacillus fortis]
MANCFLQLVLFCFQKRFDENNYHFFQKGSDAKVIVKRMGYQDHPKLVTYLKAKDKEPSE